MKSFDEIYGWVKDLPIIDWHNHLDVGAVAADKSFGSLYEVWVKADPYKHRAMRICGVPERLITGDAPEAEKMAAWEATLPKLVGNPLFIWSQQELAFLNEELRMKDEELSIGNLQNVSLGALTPKKVLKAFNVEYWDPGFRMNAGDAFDGAAAEAVHVRGGRILDISIDDVSVPGLSRSVRGSAAFAKAHGWTMLLHMGALRSTSDRLRQAAGPAGGYAGMRAPVDPQKVAELLNGLERDGVLPRTILLSLNPEAHAQLAVLAGSFVEDGVPGKVQLGPAWWWCDHRDGIFDVFEKSAAYGVLATFVGMTTDSRSFLSFVRHDYFRRLLARWVARKVADGDFPDDEALLRPICENICYRNAKGMIG